MKKLLITLLLTTTLVGCTTKTEFGPCIGAFDEKDPAKIYKVSGWNIAMGILFMEFVVPPIVVLVDNTHCPVGNK